MKKALLFFSTAFFLAPVSTCLAAEEWNISGVIQSIDRQARVITLTDDTSYTLRRDASTSWLQPGNRVDLLCNFDAGVVVDCGVGIGSIPEDALDVIPAEPKAGPDLAFGEKRVDGVPENVLPDEPTYRLENLLHSLDEK